MKKPSNQELVAYLDGELEPDAADAVEQAIATDPQLQHEVDSMMRAYDLLDTLVPPQASQEFTQNTLRTVHALESRTAKSQTGAENVVATQPLPAIALTGIPTTWLAAWAAGLVLCSAFGFMLTNRWLAPESRDIAADLPVIERLKVFQDANSVDFVEGLLERRFHEPLGQPQPMGQTNGNPQPFNPNPSGPPVDGNGDRDLGPNPGLGRGPGRIRPSVESRP